MPNQPRLIPVTAPRNAEAVAIVAHGGASRNGDPMVSPTQLSVLRMIPVARRLARTARGRLAVYRLLNSSRGWDTRHTPVDDVAWAIGLATTRHPDVPVGLVGHSLGGRAVLLAGADPAVSTVVALNAFVFPHDAPRLEGRQVLFVHGDSDRIARCERATVVADRVGRDAATSFVTVPGGRHAMLRHGREFERAAAEYVTATCTSHRPRGGWSRPVEAVLAGEPWVTA